MNPVGLGDLKNLFLKCVEQKHIKYVVFAVRLYERKGYDFTEEINSLFVKACIRGGSPDVAATELAKYKYRIGAWTTTTSLNRLLEALKSSPDAKLTSQLMQTLSLKGLVFAQISYDLALNNCVDRNDLEAYDIVHNCAKLALKNEELIALDSKYTRPDPPKNVSTEENNSSVIADK